MKKTQDAYYQSPQIAISVNNLQKSYKNVQVLNGLSFEVKKGSIFALLGTNGSGKTTTINILTTLIKADKGKMTINGYDTTLQADKVRQQFSLTGQFAAVDDILTARENLVMICELRKVDNSKQTTDRLLEQFDLIEAAHRRVSTFSGGMRRRLDIAMSLIGNPSTIFLDEPTTGLDPQSRNALWTKIKTLAHNGTTVFLTTQYLEEADQLADRIAILNKGIIVAEGTVAELKTLQSIGNIELKFKNINQLTLAQNLLHEFVFESNYNTRALNIKTEGNLLQVAGIFSKLHEANIDIAEFSQKEPTLEDIFLKIISEDKYNN
jgi:ABC-2 type transport system ATP-binding protein